MGGGEDTLYSCTSLQFIYVEKTKLLKVVKIQSDAGVTVDDEQIGVGEHFMYLGKVCSVWCRFREI